jgi:transposase
LEFCPFRGFIHGAHRHEALLFPERLDDDMAAEHPGRVLEAVVDHRTRTLRGCQRATPAATGRPADDPAERLKLDLDGDRDRLRSSRRLDQATPRQVELRWRFKQLRPDHKTMADFRQHHLQPLRPVCRAFTVLCTQLHRFAGALVAIDGRQGTAVTAKARHFTPDQRTTLLAQRDPRRAGSRQALAGQETPEEAGTPGGAVADPGQAKRAALPPRKLREAAVHAP